VAKVAVVGLGGMGSRIARRVLDAGHELTVWNRSREKAEPLGVPVAASPAEAASEAEVVITMVADPPALAAVTEGLQGVAAGADEGTTVIEMSTVGPAAIERLRSFLRADLLDAPVLGSLSEAESGTLSIFVGGDEDVFERRRDLLEALGKPIYIGPSGSGAAAKLVANSTLITVIGALGEALALADALGLPCEKAFESPGHDRPRRPGGAPPPRTRVARLPAALPAQVGAQGRRPDRRARPRSASDRSGPLVARRGRRRQPGLLGCPSADPADRRLARPRRVVGVAHQNTGLAPGERDDQNPVRPFKPSGLGEHLGPVPADRDCERQLVMTADTQHVAATV